MPEKINICAIGLGPVGRFCAKIANERPDLELVAAVDVNPEIAGCDLGEILGQPHMGVRISGDMDEALSVAPKGVVVLCTTSILNKISEQIRECVKAGWHVVSTCEELAYPWRSAPQLAEAIDQWARDAGRCVLGTGVNPGFVMDALPTFITSACRRVDTILIERFQDASIRRLPFQQKIGAGLSLDDFEAKVANGIIRHVGFKESINMIADALGIELEKVQERVMPVMATRHLESEFTKIAPGMVCGVNQLAQGFNNGDALITLNLQAYFGHPQPRERIVVTGEPDVEMVIPGGVHGDIATCAMTVNAVYRVFSGKPGLRTMLDLGLTAGRHF